MATPTTPMTSATYIRDQALSAAGDAWDAADAAYFKALETYLAAIKRAWATYDATVANTSMATNSTEMEFTVAEALAILATGNHPRWLAALLWGRRHLNALLGCTDDAGVVHPATIPIDERAPAYASLTGLLGSLWDAVNGYDADASPRVREIAYLATLTR